MILKGSLRLIMKRSKVSLRNMSDIVEIYIVLHDVYIIINEEIGDVKQKDNMLKKLVRKNTR